MKIKKIKINGFRGLKELEFDFNEELNIFSGQNQLGKTSIIDSIMWVLCDETLVNGKQDSDNRNMLDLKQPLNVILEMDNGLILERKYRDIWVEDEDGNLKYSRTDNQFYVNGAKYKKEEYFDFIKENIGINKIIKTKDFNLLRGIMDYNYYSNIDYKIARKFTEELMDLKSDLELLNQEEFNPIKIDMQVLKFDCGKCANKYKNEFDKIDIQIKEKENLKENLFKTINEKELEKGEKLFEERRVLLNDNVLENSDYKALNQLLEENRVNIQEEEKNVITSLNNAKNEINDLISKGNKCNYNIENCQDKIKNLINEEKNLLENNKFNQLQIQKSKELAFDEIICPHCNGLVNEKQKDEFNNKIKNIQLNHKNNIEKNNQRIQEIHKDIEILQNKINSTKKELNDYRKQYVECDNKIKQLNDEIQNNTKVKELLLKKEELNNNIKEFINNYNTEKNNKINELTIELDKLSSMLDNKNRVENLKVEIQELKKKKAYLDMQRELVKDFKDLKRNMIKENTNKIFPNINIEIIEENENTGATKDVCYATLKGVEYKAINDGHRYLVGISIIEDIKRALGLQDLPIIFDKFADIDTNTFNEIKKITKSQIITTLVSNNNTILLNNKENN